MRRAAGIVSLITLCTLLPIGAAGADSDYTQEIVALLKDPAYTETIVLAEDVDIREGYGVYIYGPEDREKVLDLNGHTLSCETGMDNHGNFRVTDSAGGGALELNRLALTNYGALTIDGAAVEGKGGECLLRNRWDGTFRLVSGCISAENLTFALKNMGGTCVIDGGAISGGIDSTQGSELYPAYAYDEEGNVIAGSTGTRWHDGALTINGGLLEGSLQVRDTELTITGGTFRGWVYGAANDVEYRNAAGELAVIPGPTYELHWENGEMKRGYWDVSGEDWYYTPVQAMMDRGVLDYGKNGILGPAESLTRGQAAALLSRACGLEAEAEAGPSPFHDVTADTPYARYISTAQRAGLLAGDGNGRFRPEDIITRQEFAVLVGNAVRGSLVSLPDEAQPAVFSDEEAIAPWARDAVLEEAAHGLWRGDGGGHFAPQAPITRAEAAAVLARLMEAAGTGI